MHNYQGERFGKLVVIERNGSRNNRVVWKCQCDCGKVVDVVSQDLTRGHTKSCGCLHLESVSKHGGRKDRLYSVWHSMIRRCETSTDKEYKYYGAKGVAVCEAWHDYILFKKWALDNGYDENAKYGDCTIDRINPNGNYEPSNCRWVDMKTQNNNKTKIIIQER